MKAGLILFVTTFASMLGSSFAVAGDLPSDDGWHDVRVLYEFAGLDFARVDSVDENWAIVRVVKGPPISEELIPLEARAQARQWGSVADLVNATGHPVATLRGTVADGRWSCFAPIPARITFGSLDITMVDRSVGTCVCRVNGKIAGAGRPVLQESRLIPRDWVTHIGPAFNRWRESRDAFTGEADPTRRKRLLELTKDENPVLAFMAYRRLAESSQLALSDVPAYALNPRDDLGIFVAYVALDYMPQSRQDDLFQQMRKWVDSAEAVEELHGIATACALDVGPRRKVSVEERASYRILAHIEARAAILTKDREKDEYLGPAMQQLRSYRPSQP